MTVVLERAISVACCANCGWWSHLPADRIHAAAQAHRDEAGHTTRVITTTTDTYPAVTHDRDAA